MQLHTERKPLQCESPEKIKGKGDGQTEIARKWMG